MPGLFLGVNGGVRTANAGNPSTAAEAAYGPGYSASGTPSTSAALAPNDPFGVAFFVGLGAFGFLMLIRYSLPR